MPHDLTSPRFAHHSGRARRPVNAHISLTQGTADISTARRFVREALAAHDLDAGIVDDIALAASELVTNAIEHGADQPVDLAVDLEPQHVRLSVTSRGNTSDLPSGDRWVVADVSSVTGRGLGIVRALVDRVDVDRQGDSVTITVRRSIPTS